MNIHLPAILGFTRYQGFDPSPFGVQPSATANQKWRIHHPKSLIDLLKLEFTMRDSAPTKSSLNRRSVSGLGLKSVPEKPKDGAFETMLFALKNWVFVCFC